MPLTPQPFSRAAAEERYEPSSDSHQIQWSCALLVRLVIGMALVCCRRRRERHYGSTNKRVWWSLQGCYRMRLSLAFWTLLISWFHHMFRCLMGVHFLDLQRSFSSIWQWPNRSLRVIWIS